jgi:hypothetical protein
MVGVGETCGRGSGKDKDPVQTLGWLSSRKHNETIVTKRGGGHGDHEGDEIREEEQVLSLDFHPQCVEWLCQIHFLNVLLDFCLM